jgi:hypothetical protein
MVENNGSCANEEAFWNDFANIYGAKALTNRPLFDDFYAVDFQEAKAILRFYRSSV